MTVSGKFNRGAFDAPGSALAGPAENAGEAFNPFAPNTLVTPANAVKLAALEDAAEGGIIRRVTTGEHTRESKERKSAREEAQWRAVQQRWDAQLVTVGGVSMTNAQAQAARRRILENPDYYARWAKQRGLIKEGEEQQFVDTARRITDLKDRERNGELSAEQKEEMTRLQNSRLGRAMDQATGQAHLDKGRRLEAREEQVTRGAGDTASATQLYNMGNAMFAASSEASLPGDKPGYAKEPPLKGRFDMAKLATKPALPSSDMAVTGDKSTPAENPVAAASGLNL